MLQACANSLPLHSSPCTSQQVLRISQQVLKIAFDIWTFLRATWACPFGWASLTWEHKIVWYVLVHREVKFGWRSTNLKRMIWAGCGLDFVVACTSL